MRRVLAFVLTLLLTALSISASSADDPRMIWVLVVKPPDIAAPGVASWVQLFKHNVPVLLSEVSGGTTATDRVFDLKVDDRTVAEAKPADLKAYYESQPSLGALSTVASSDGSTTFLDNDIYIGHLKGRLPKPFIHFSYSVLPSEYRNSRDATSVVTLYTYAMLLAQAKADAADPYAVCLPLIRARSYIPGLGGEVQNDLRDLILAISQELETRKCGRG